MISDKKRILLCFYGTYLLYLALSLVYTVFTGSGPAAAPFHLLCSLVLWPAAAYLCIRKAQPPNLMNSQFNIAFQWLFHFLPYDIVCKVLLPLPHRMTWRTYWSSQLPWLPLLWLVIFAAPFLAVFLHLHCLSDKPCPKKVAVLGGGIGGLTAAIYAARAGFETALYEQHAIVGGECTGWDRKDYHIDNCIHWLIGTKPGTDLNELWQTTGLLGKDVPVYRADRMYTSELNGQTLTLWQDIDRTERDMIALSPQDEEQIRSLMNACRMAQKVCIPAGSPSELQSFSGMLKMTKESGSALKIFKLYRGMNVQDLMERFQHPLIRCLISDFTPADSSASGFPMAYGNFTAGDGGIPAGGSRAAADRMRQTLERFGGKVFTGRRAVRILLAGRKATGVLFEDGSQINCDYVIPACDASVTFGTLLPERYREPLMTKMYEDRRAYPVYSTFQTALALKDSVDPFPADYIWDAPELVFAPGMGSRITVKSYSYEPSFAPGGQQLLQTLQGGSESVFSYWEELYRDPGAYRKKKLELAELTKRQIEAKFPALSGKLTVLDVWTPMTYVRYCSAYKGFYQSFMTSKYSARLPYPSAYVRGLSNVILAGQWINPPGGLPGSATAGKFAAQRILYLENRRF